MRFPYGLVDFRKIREEGYFYVDRTDRIALIEEVGHQLHLALIVRPDRRQYALLDHLLEFRTLSLKAVGLTSAERATKTREESGALPAVQAKLPAAERQLAGYRATLEQAYGGVLKLRTRAVVCISLERLVY